MSESWESSDSSEENSPLYSTESSYDSGYYSRPRSGSGSGSMPRSGSRSRSRSRSMSGLRSHGDDEGEGEDISADMSRLFASHDSDEHDDDEDFDLEPKRRDAALGYREFIEFANVEEVICMYCFGVPNDPIRLTCGHSMCRACAREAVDLFKSTSLFTKRFELRDCEVSNEDCCLTCPVCMETVIVKGGVESAEADEHMKKLCEINEIRHGRPLCGMCVSEACSGCSSDVREGVIECDICGPLCAKHGCLHSIETGHSKYAYKIDGGNHMTIVTSPKVNTRVFSCSKKFDLLKLGKGAIVLDKDSSKCEVYCMDCKQPISINTFYRFCAPKNHNVVSFEKAKEELRKDKAAEDDVEAKIQGISSKCDEMEDDIVDIMTKLCVTKSLVEDDVCINNLDQARDLIKSCYSRIRAACDAAEAESIQRLEKEASSIKERMNSVCDATTFIIENAQRVASDATTALATANTEKVNLDGIDDTLKRYISQIHEASDIRQTPYDMLSFVQESRSFTDEELKVLLPCGLKFSDAFGEKPKQDAESTKTDEEEKPDDSSKEKAGPPSIEEARKRIKETIDSSEDKKINSRYSSLKSVIGSSFDSMSDDEGQQMVCAAIFDIISNVRPHFDESCIFLLTEAFASIHDMDDVREKYQRVSDLFHELQAIALTLDLDL